MKYKTRIVPENDGYVGYALLSDEVVFVTKVCRDVATASKDLSSYITSATPPASPGPVQRSINSSVVEPNTNHIIPAVKTTPIPPPASMQIPAPPPRRCCGR